jgi:hypothetical protein
MRAARKLHATFVTVRQFGDTGDPSEQL